MPGAVDENECWLRHGKIELLNGKVRSSNLYCDEDSARAYGSLTLR